MKTRLMFTSVLFLLQNMAWSQTLDSLKLTADELPSGYNITQEILSNAVQPKIFYDNPDLYESILGKVKGKDHQSFESKMDSGTVFFYEYFEKIHGEAFLEGLLWGGNKATKDHPEEYFIKDNFLIIWSFEKRSLVKKLSIEKVKRSF